MLKLYLEFFNLRKQETLKRHSKEVPVQFHLLLNGWLMAVKLSDVLYCDVFLKDTVKHSADPIQSGTDLVWF